MLSIDAGKLRLTLAKLQEVRKTTIKKGDAGYRQKLFYLFDQLLKISPQFSGDFVSNWQLTVDGNLGSYKRYVGKGGGDGSRMKENANGTYSYVAARHKMGDPEAMRSALARGAAMLNGVTTKSRVQFINLTALHSTGTQMVNTADNTVVNLRVENILPGNVRIESYLRALAKNPKEKALS